MQLWHSDFDFLPNPAYVELVGPVGWSGRPTVDIIPVSKETGDERRHFRSEKYYSLVLPVAIPRIQ